MTARVFGNSPEETNIGNANNVIIGDNNSSRSVASFMSGSRNTVGIDCENIAVVNTNYSNVLDSCSGVTLMNCSGIFIGGSCHDIALVNCFDVTVEELTYGFSGFNLSGNTITTSNNNTTRFGDSSTFEFSGTTL
jgi:hypothetical protein